jgi:hypothetical protein
LIDLCRSPDRILWSESINYPAARLGGMIVSYLTRAEAAKRAAGSLYAPKPFSARTKRLVRWLQRPARARNKADCAGR